MDDKVFFEVGVPLYLVETKYCEIPIWARLPVAVDLFFIATDTRWHLTLLIGCYERCAVKGENLFCIFFRWPKFY